MPPIIPALLLAYGLGCLSTGYYLARARGVDLRAAGSGSTGARNAGRLLGARAFVLTFGLDLAKGAAAVLLAHWLAPGPWAAPSALLLVVAGHVWPLQLRFQGGRGISPAVGGMLALSPLLTAMVAIPLLIGWGLARSFKRGGMLAVVVSPILAWCLRHRLGLVWQDSLALSLLAALLVSTHLRTLKIPEAPAHP